MVIKIIAAFALAFLSALGIGQVSLPWLKKHGFVQPLKDEVAQMYAGTQENSADGN